MAYDDEDDLNKWLASQRAPSFDAPQSEAPQGGGAWSRAAQLLASGGYGSDPAPKNDISWKTVLGMVLSKDPGAVMLADQEGRRRQIDDWAARHSPEAVFDRQRALAGTLMQEDAGKRATAAQQFEQDRATANDIEQAANTDWAHEHTEGRDAATDQHWSAEEQRARDQMAQADRHFDVSQSGMDARQLRQLQAQREMNDADNAAALAAAQARAAGKPPAPLPGTHVTDPAAFQQYMQSPANVKDLSEHVARSQQVQQYVDQLRDLLQKPRTAAGEATYNSIIKQLIGDRSQEGSTGVLSNTEFARYIEDLPAYGALGGLKNWRSALETIQGKNPRLSTLDALEQSLRKGQGAKLGAYGIALGDADPSAPQPPAATDVLPTTAPPKQWRNAPKVDEYLKKLAEDDNDLGVTYGR